MSAEAIAADAGAQATRLREFAASRSLGPEIDAAIAALVFRFEGLRGKAAAADAWLAADPGRADAATLGGFQAAFLDEAGLVGRPSNRNLAAAADRYTGYGASTWPLLREALEDAEPGSAAGLADVLAAARRNERAAERFEAALRSVLPETVPATSGTP